MMTFQKVPDLAGSGGPLRDQLLSNLRANKKVLWLVPGGSNIPLSVNIMAEIPAELTPNLTIMLTDERYGAVGHPDSNMRQLADLGFEPANATVVATLMPSLDLAATTKRYAQEIAEALAATDVAIGQFGMGPDGHIAGILPGSPAVTSTELAAGYETETFTRITLTPKALTQLDQAFVYAFGEAKLTALQHLHDHELPLEEQPAQLIKQIPLAYVVNDMIGDAA